MSIKEFIDENGTNLIIEHNKTNIVFKTDNKIKIERPCEDCQYMYKFNKRRMESFIYDLKK